MTSSDLRSQLQYIESIVHDSKIIEWNSMVPYVELTFGQITFNQWPPAVMDHMRVAADVSH